MSKASQTKKQSILAYIDEHYNNYGETPTVREISAGTGIAVTSVHRYLSEMQADGELNYNGRRSVSTKRMELEQTAHAMPVLGFVACGEGQEEVEEVLEYIRMPESLVGKGEFFALIAKGESMVDANIFPGDHVVIRKQNTAEVGDIVVALYEGTNNLKVLKYDSDRHIYFLRSCNKDKETYRDIYPDDLSIQGVAVCVTHKLNKVL